MIYKDEVVSSSSASSLTQWFGFDQFQPERAVTSHFVSTRTFLYIRAVQVLYSGAVQWASIWWMASHYSLTHYFAYFTYYTFIGLHFYFLVSELRENPLDFNPRRFFFSFNSPPPFFLIDFILSSCTLPAFF